MLGGWANPLEGIGRMPLWEEPPASGALSAAKGTRLRRWRNAACLEIHHGNFNEQIFKPKHSVLEVCNDYDSTLL
jgi:hypothetical protein